MDLLNSLLNLVVPPVSLGMLACAWPTLSFFRTCEWLIRSIYSENMQDKMVVFTGASSEIGEDINFWGNVYPAFVALPYLCQSNDQIVVNASVENWLPMPKMGLYAAAKAAVMNFYETLRFELRDEVGLTIASHGWVGSEKTRGKLMLEEGSEMQWKEESEVSLTGGYVEEYARLIVSGARRGDSYVKFSGCYDIFLLYRLFAPSVLVWTFRLLFLSQGSIRKFLVGTGRPLLESTPPRLLTLQQQQKLE